MVYSLAKMEFGIIIIKQIVSPGLRYFVILKELSKNPILFQKALNGLAGMLFIIIRTYLH